MTTNLAQLLTLTAAILAGLTLIALLTPHHPDHKSRAHIGEPRSHVHTHPPTHDTAPEPPDDHHV